MTYGGFSENQAALSRAVADFVTRESARSGTDGRPRGAYDAKSWLRAADVGLPGLLVAERWGGIGQGWVEAAIASDQFGRAVWPSPHLLTMLTSGLMGLVASSEHQ